MCVKHKFEPRYDRKCSKQLAKALAEMTPEQLGKINEAHLMDETYIYDICPTCGKRVEQEPW